MVIDVLSQFLALLRPLSNSVAPSLSGRGARWPGLAAQLIFSFCEALDAVGLVFIYLSSSYGSSYGENKSTRYKINKKLFIGCKSKRIYTRDQLQQEQIIK